MLLLCHVFMRWTPEANHWKTLFGAAVPFLMTWTESSPFHEHRYAQVHSSPVCVLIPVAAYVQRVLHVTDIADAEIAAYELLPPCTACAFGSEADQSTAALAAVAARLGVRVRPSDIEFVLSACPDVCAESSNKRHFVNNCPALNKWGKVELRESADMDPAGTCAHCLNNAHAH